MKNINIEQVINKWFEMKLNTYDKLEHDDSIYLYYEGEVYADIRINKKNNLIYYQSEVWKEFSDITPLERFEFHEFMVKWIEDTFSLKRLTTGSFIPDFLVRLKIPNNCL